MTITAIKPVTVSSITMDSWQEKKSKLKEKFPHLTESDLDFEEGKVEGMIYKIHSKIGKTIGKTKDGLHKFIEVI